MPLAAFVFAVLALLVAPGPTNTLMGIARAQRGPPRVLRLIPAELAGYLTTILPLTWAGAQFLDRSSGVAVALKMAAAVWVMILALKLWRDRPGEGEATGVGVVRVYVTTVLNPKALIFGLVLLPAPQDAEFPLRLGLLCAMVTGVALLWGGAGRLTQAGGGGAARLRMLQRVASVWLAFVSLTLVVNLLGAMQA